MQHFKPHNIRATILSEPVGLWSPNPDISVRGNTVDHSMLADTLSKGLPRAPQGGIFSKIHIKIQ